MYVPSIFMHVRQPNNGGAAGRDAMYRVRKLTAYFHGNMTDQKSDKSSTENEFQSRTCHYDYS